MAILHESDPRMPLFRNIEGAHTHVHVCDSGGCHNSWRCEVWDGSCADDLCQSCELARRDEWIKSVMAKGRS